MASQTRHVVPVSPVPSDLVCSHCLPPVHIRDIAHSVGIQDDELELYGDHKAKARLELIVELHFTLALDPFPLARILQLQGSFLILV